MSADPFGSTDKLDAALLDAIAVRLEARGRHPAFAAMLAEYLEAMRIDEAASVLDLGCGTGLAARAIARRAGFAGRVTGIDLSPQLVQAAQRLAAEEGVAARVAFRAGDTRRLGLPHASFDAVVAHTLLSHVEDPLAVVREAAQLLKPGGMLGIFDGDYASLTFGNADAERGRAGDTALIGAIVTNPWVMRQMPRMLRAAGLQLVAAFPHVLAEVGDAEFWLSGIEMFRKLMAKAGTMSAEAADAWAASLVADAKNGVFFGASNYYSYVARRPAG
jgi:ubiquinone/menaquinone biosynthesis C-methylase UbiE